MLRLNKIPTEDVKFLMWKIATKGIGFMNPEFILRIMNLGIVVSMPFV